MIYSINKQALEPHVLREALKALKIRLVYEPSQNAIRAYTGLNSMLIRHDKGYHLDLLFTLFEQEIKQYIVLNEHTI